VPQNDDGSAGVTTSVAAVASMPGLLPVTPNAPSSDIPDLVISMTQEDAADLDIDDMPVVVHTEGEFPCSSNGITGFNICTLLGTSPLSLTGEAELPGCNLLPKDSCDLLQSDVVTKVIATSKVEKQKPNDASKHKRASRDIGKNDALFNKKRTFSLKEYVLPPCIRCNFSMHQAVTYLQSPSQTHERCRSTSFRRRISALIQVLFSHIFMTFLCPLNVYRL
jgi:hypothetical protein